MRHFLAIINAHVDVCRIVRLLDCFVFCFASFECMNILCIHSFWRGCLFVLAILFQPFHHCTGCCHRFPPKICPPFRAVLCSFCLFSFAVEFGGIYFGDLILGLLSFSLFLFFFGHLLLFWRFDHFRVADGCTCFYLFHVISCAFLVSLVYECIWTAYKTLCASKNPLDTLWWSNSGRAILAIHVPPPHVYPQLCPAHPIITQFTFFCVCWVLMHPPAPIRTHPHPPQSLLTLYVCAQV